MSAAASSCATGIPEFMRAKAVPAADIVTPNQFELDYLAGRDEQRRWRERARRDRCGARSRAARGPGDLAAHRRRRPTDCDRSAGLGRDGRFPRAHAAAAADGERRRRRHRRAVLRALSAQRPVDEALSRAASSVFGVLRKTAEAGAREILLVAAQDEIVKPTPGVRRATNCADA